MLEKELIAQRNQWMGGFGGCKLQNLETQESLLPPFNGHFLFKTIAKLAKQTPLWKYTPIRNTIKGRREKKIWFLRQWKRYSLDEAILLLTFRNRKHLGQFMFTPSEDTHSLKYLKTEELKEIVDYKT